MPIRRTIKTKKNTVQPAKLPQLSQMELSLLRKEKNLQQKLGILPGDMNERKHVLMLDGQLVEVSIKPINDPTLSNISLPGDKPLTSDRASNRQLNSLKEDYQPRLHQTQQTTGQIKSELSSDFNQIFKEAHSIK